MWFIGKTWPCRIITMDFNCSSPLQLFLFLQEFSQRMLSKTHEIEKQLDGLIRDTKATDCCLHTVFNDFLMLSNTQFIENVGDFALTFSEIHRNTENNLSCVFLQKIGRAHV